MTGQRIKHPWLLCSRSGVHRDQWLHGIHRQHDKPLQSCQLEGQYLSVKKSFLPWPSSLQSALVNWIIFSVALFFPFQDGLFTWGGITPAAGLPPLVTTPGVSDTTTTVAVNAPQSSTLILPENNIGLFNLTAAKLPEFIGQVIQGT